MSEQEQINPTLISKHIAVHTGQQVRTCRLVSSRRKLRKHIFEFEADGRRYIGKKFETEDAGKLSHEALRGLWLSGFRSPSPFTVPAPVAYLPEHKLLLMEKAQGETLHSLLFREDAWHTA